jgi:RNA polymerase sigma factor (TIGR02999 family)
MDENSPKTITRLIGAAHSGDIKARDQLYEFLYSHLIRMARSHLRRSATMTLDPAAVLHEAYLRIDRVATKGQFENRRLFLGYASNVMHSVIVDYVRERRAHKRGGGGMEVTLDTGLAEMVSASDDGILGVHEALVALEGIDPRAFRVVEMRYFGGLTEQEIADVLDISVPTVKRDWRKARAFLFDCLRSDG